MPRHKGQHARSSAGSRPSAREGRYFPLSPPSEGVDSAPAGLHHAAGRSPSSAGTAGNALTFCAGILLIAVLIQAAGWWKGDALVFPGVGEILKAFCRLIRTARTWELIGVTIGHLLLSMVLSTGIGVGIGLAEGMKDTVRTLLRPLMILLRSIPMIVLIVIIMVLMKYDRVPVVASSLILIPIISEATCEGCRRIEPELIDVYRLNGSFSLPVLWHVYLPLMTGYLKQAYINAVGTGLKLAVTTEYLVQTRNSLGKAIYSSAYFNEYQDIYAYALIMILLVLLVSEAPMALLRLRERRAGSGGFAGR